MHMRHSDEEHGPPVVPVTFILEDPEGLTDTEQTEWELMGGEKESLLELALENGINIEHACGGVCACSTCHVYVEEGMDQITPGPGVEPQRGQGDSALTASAAGPPIGSKSGPEPVDHSDSVDTGTTRP